MQLYDSTFKYVPCVLIWHTKKRLKTIYFIKKIKSYEVYFEDLFLNITQILFKCKNISISNYI